MGIDVSVTPVRPGGEPGEALEAIVVESLLKPPCLVAFSGGRDSSAVLAAATASARKHGLEAPIPFTMRMPDAPASMEDHWQELVIRHLGLEQWQVEEHGSQLDFLGPFASEALHGHGLVWPPNAHFMLPAIRLATGGSLLTGAFGDEIFTEDARRTAARRSRYGSIPLTPRAALRVVLAAGPPRVRRWDARRRIRRAALPDWLRPPAAEIVRERLARQKAVAPLRWDRAAVTFPRLRYYRAGSAALEALGAANGTAVTAPLGDVRFVAAVAKRAGKVGFASRTEAMRELFGDLLPDEVITRSGKAAFGRAFWGAATREFAHRWSGSGLPEELIDAEALRTAWKSACEGGVAPAFAFQAATALQAAYLVT